MLRDHAVVVAAPPKAPEPAKDELPDFLKPIEEQEAQKLILIIKADTAGSLEAVAEKLGDRVDIVASGVGEISENDIELAKSTKAFIVGFNVGASSSVRKLADVEGVVFRTYNLIYELLEELEEVISGMEEVITREREVGHGEIIAEFPFKKSRIAGTKVQSGRLAKGDMVKVMRGEKEIGRGKILSIRRGKEEVTKVAEGLECGVLIGDAVDFQINDDIIAFTSS
jgi:translation initiation factor IF-2